MGGTKGGVGALGGVEASEEVKALSLPTSDLLAGL